jgi:molecular chaperone IbpA
MTNLTLRSLDIPTLHRHAIGFDNMFNRLLNATAQTTNYPPYNIIKQTDDKYIVEVAVAGFKEGEIDVTVENNTLTVSGEKFAETTADYEYLHRGISARSFLRTFTIGDYVEVVSATIEDGILTIACERQVPEEKKPKKVAITYAGAQKLTNSKKSRSQADSE